MRTAKLFMNGRSQAVRLPSEFRCEGNEVGIRKNEETGEIILSPKSSNWDRFFELRDQLTQEERDELVIPPRDRSPLRVTDLGE